MERLKLDHNACGEFARQLAAAIAQSRSLREIDLSACDLASAAVEFGQLFADNDRLTVMRAGDRLILTAVVRRA